MLDLGPCQVLFGDAGSEVDLGVTSGGVRFIDEISTQDLTTDQFWGISRGQRGNRPQCSRGVQVRRHPPEP
jgi:hypothetical protein